MPVRPTTDRRLKTIFPPKVGIASFDCTSLRRDIIRFAKRRALSMDIFFSLATALAISEYCDTDYAALTWAYVGRERTEEKRIFGSLHKDIPFKISRNCSREEMIDNARVQMRDEIAHCDYPFTLMSPYNNRWNYAVNVLRVENEHELIKLLPPSVELIPTPPQKYAYALLDVEIHESFERLEIVFRYSATHYKESSIHRFSELVRKYALWLLSE